MAKQTKNNGAQEAPELAEEEAPELAEEEAATDDEVDFLVVVCKGHTLWHNGEKYPQFRRLRMDADDADRLFKRGVVVKYADLLKEVSDHAD
ncbi:hypothetical protein AU652_20930 [Salmonella enterica subsp. enterica serovar Minnesota]|nr:hypothetical protein [Salmonella enterica subsp. enterica serovar Minnesota]EEI6485884.1 hypothetical protein [Salmonella enterica]